MSARSRPIFIVGSGRSGTSVLTWAIGQHPNIIATPETNWLTALACYLDGMYAVGLAAAPEDHLSLWNVTREKFLREFGLAVDGIVRRTFECRFPDRRTSMTDSTRNDLAWFRSLGDPKTRWIDGTPSSTGYAGVLAQMFPESAFINLVRDPSDVVKSWMGASFRHADVASSRELLNHVYHSQKAGYLVHAAFGERTIRVLFEDLIANPESVLRGILSFLEEEYSPDCIKPLARKINSSGETKPSVLREFDSVSDSGLMREMQEWYRAARDPHWRLEADASIAADCLARYAKYRIPIPVS